MGGCFSIRDRTAAAAKAGAERKERVLAAVAGGMPQLSQHSWSNSFRDCRSRCYNIEDPHQQIPAPYAKHPGSAPMKNK